MCIRDRLENGQVVIVPAILIKHLPQHHITLPWDIDVIIGKNGVIWISRSIPDAWKDQEENLTQVPSDDNVPLAETLQRLKHRHASTPMTLNQRLNIARVSNVINCLGLMHMSVTPESITTLYQKSIDLKLEAKVFELC